MTLMCAACTTVLTPSASPDVLSPTEEPRPTRSTPSESESAPPPSEQTVAGLEIPSLGHPFDAGSLLAAMRDSRRPGGVPDQIETDAIATSVADTIWTYDGQPWATMAVGGSCGPERCTLEVAGAAPDGEGDDVWVFTVTPATGEVVLLTSELGSVPPGIVAALDALARALDESGALDGMLLANASWMPPPDEGEFALSYRSGGEEGSCGVDLTLDAVKAEVISSTTIGC